RRAARPFWPLLWPKRPWKLPCRAGSELPVSAMPRPSGRVSTGCSASPVLSLRKLYLTQWCAPAPRARSKLIGRYGALHEITGRWPAVLVLWHDQLLRLESTRERSLLRRSRLPDQRKSRNWHPEILSKHAALQPTRFFALSRAS